MIQHSIKHNLHCLVVVLYPLAVARMDQVTSWAMPLSFSSQMCALKVVPFCSLLLIGRYLMGTTTKLQLKNVEGKYRKLIQIPCKRGFKTKRKSIVLKVIFAFVNPSPALACTQVYGEKM